MSLLLGSTAYAIWKKQTAFGTKASLATAATIASPVSEGTVIRPRQYRQPKNDHVNAQQRVSDLYNIPKLADYQATFLLYQDVTLIDWLCAGFGTEIRTGVAAPFTHKWFVANPIYDGGTDPGSGAGTYFGRALTFHWAHRGPAGSGADYIGWEIESAVVNQLQLTFEQSQVAKLMVSGVGCNYLKAVPAAVFTYPASAPFDWSHLQSAAGPPTSGIWVKSAASPAAPAQGTDDMIVSKLTFTLNNNLLIQPQIGNTSSNYFRKPDRDGYPEMVVELEGLADTNTGKFDAVTAIDSFINSEKVNIETKASVGTNSILDLAILSASNGAGIFDQPDISYNGEGVMRFRTRFIAYPLTPSTDATLTLTSGVS